MCTEGVGRDDPGGGEVGRDAGPGQLGTLGPVQQHQREVVHPRHLVVHQQPVQLHHEVDLERGGQSAQCRVQKVSQVQTEAGSGYRHKQESKSRYLYMI